MSHRKLLIKLEKMGNFTVFVRLVRHEVREISSGGCWKGKFRAGEKLVVKSYKDWSWRWFYLVFLLMIWKHIKEICL